MAFEPRKIYEIQNIGKGEIINIQPENLLELWDLQTNQLWRKGNGYNSLVPFFSPSSANAQSSVAIGEHCIADGLYSFAEGYNTQSTGRQSHAEGEETLASGDSSHAEGSNTQALAEASHAEGSGTTAQGLASHAQGNQTQALGSYSFASGEFSVAQGYASFVHGRSSYVNGNNSIVLGVSITGNSDNTTYVDNFNIKTLGGGSAVNNLGIDANGNVVPASAGFDTYVSGMTFNNSNYNLTLNRNDGVNITQNLGILASDMTITGGTYNSSTGVATFTNNTGGTFTVTGFLTGMTDIFVTGGTYSNGTATFRNSSGGTFNVTGFKTSDLVVTGGTYNASSGTATFTNSSGGTFNVTGFDTPNNRQKTITGNYTLTSADDNYSILVNGGASPITITVPTSLTSKIQVGFIQQGTGDVTFSPSGTTINTPISGAFKIKGQNYNAYLEQVGSTNVYQLLGNLKV